MEDFFKHDWYGRYWLTLLLENRLFLLGIAVAVLLVYWLTRVSKRR